VLPDVVTVKHARRPPSRHRARATKWPSARPAPTTFTTRSGDWIGWLRFGPRQRAACSIRSGCKHTVSSVGAPPGPCLPTKSTHVPSRTLRRLSLVPEQAQGGSDARGLVSHVTSLRKTQGASRATVLTQNVGQQGQCSILVSKVRSLRGSQADSGAWIVGRHAKA